YTAAQIQEYFGAQLSFPHNVLELAPCGVRITETTFETGLKRRFEITKPKGVVVYETEWKFGRQ
ncbi:MAG: hypothetical protein WBE50_20005, partial [Methyloceanibacter sp.]